VSKPSFFNLTSSACLTSVSCRKVRKSITSLFCRCILELVHAPMSDLLRLLLNYLTDVKDLVALSGTNREWRAAISHCPVSVTIVREVPWDRFMAWITAQAPHTVSLRVSHCDVDDAGAHTICYDVVIHTALAEGILCMCICLQICSRSCVLWRCENCRISRAWRCMTVARYDHSVSTAHRLRALISCM